MSLIKDFRGILVRYDCNKTKGVGAGLAINPQNKSTKNTGSIHRKLLLPESYLQKLCNFYYLQVLRNVQLILHTSRKSQVLWKLRQIASLLVSSTSTSLFKCSSAIW